MFLIGEILLHLEMRTYHLFLLQIEKTLRRHLLRYAWNFEGWSIDSNETKTSSTYLLQKTGLRSLRHCSSHFSS